MKYSISLVKCATIFATTHLFKLGHIDGSLLAYTYTLNSDRAPILTLTRKIVGENRNLGPLYKTVARTLLLPHTISIAP